MTELAAPPGGARAAAPAAVRSRRAGPLGDLAAIALLAALTLLFFWRIWTPKAGDRGSFPTGDFWEQFYPFAAHRARELLAGEIPHWYPWAFSGAPFQADVQSAVFYPLSWPATLIFGPRGYPPIALELEAIAHIWLAATLTYLLGRSIFPDRFPSFVAALTYAFGGYLTAYPMQQLSILEVHAWLPAVILTLHRATRSGITTESRIGWAIAAGGALGLAILAGHPQAAMYLIYAGSAYAIFRLAARRDDRLRLTRATIAVLPIFLALGLGLSAIQWIPTYEFMKVTARAGIDYDFARWGFPLRDVFQLILPGVVSLMSPLYAGLGAIGLAAIAVLVGRNRRTIYWGGFTAFGLVLSFGGHTFLYGALYLLAPGFSTFRNHERAAVLVSFGLAMLAGYGAARLIATRPGAAWIARLRQAALWAALGGLLFYLAALLTNRLAPGKVDDLLDQTAFLIVLLGLFAAIVHARERGLPDRWLAGLVAAVIVLDLFTANWQVNFEKVPPGERFPERAATRYLQGHRDGGRAYNEHRLFLNYGAVYQIEDANGASPLVNARYKRLLEHEPKERFWDLFDVRHLLTWRADYGGGTKILTEKLPKGEDLHLYERPTALGRARIVHEFEVVPDDGAAFERVVAPDFDPARAAVVSEDPGVPAGGGPASGVAIVEQRPTEWILRTEAAAPGLLVLAEVDTPGWQAWVDGAPAPVLRANYAQRAIPVPAGPHEIRLSYQPPGFRLGAAVSIAALLLGAIGLGWAERRQIARIFAKGVDRPARL